MKRILFIVVLVSIALGSCKKDDKLSLGNSELNFDYVAETEEIIITSDVDWTVRATADFITLSPTKGSGNTALNISVNENFGSSERSAEVILNQVGNERLRATLKVKQKANPLVQQERMQDSLSLVAFYNATNGDEWTNKRGWKTAQLDYWYGITLNNNRNKVVRISLNDNQLSGSIPAEICDLNQLYYISLCSNQLTGSIPVEISSLSQLQQLWLEDNQLSGNIPSELGNLSQLQHLRLDNNQLSGNIPTEIFNLSLLQQLGLSNNQLTGSIPPEIGNFNLLNINLSDNQLSGSIPSELGNLSQLQHLRLDNNQLSGNIPSELGNLSQLQYLGLAFNQLSGSIPSELDNLNKLEYLFLINNQLSGDVPDAILSMVQADPDNFSICPQQGEGFSNYNCQSDELLITE